MDVIREVKVKLQDHKTTEEEETRTYEHQQ
jgi:hypothetical protein